MAAHTNVSAVHYFPSLNLALNLVGTPFGAAAGVRGAQLEGFAMAASSPACSAAFLKIWFTRARSSDFGSVSDDTRWGASVLREFGI